MQLDTQTLFTVAMITYFSGALLLGTLSAAFTTFPSHVRQSWTLWALAMAMSGTCVILVGLRSTIPDLISIGLANGLLMFSLGLRVIAIGLLYNQGASYRWLPFLLVFGWVVLYQFPWFRDYLLMRALYVNLFCILAMALCIHVCWNKGKLAKVSSIFLISVFGIDILIRLASLWFYITNMYPSLKSAFNSPEITTLIIALVFAIFLKIVGLCIAAYEQMTGQYRNLSLQDPMTGLPVRHAFTQASQSELKLMRGQSKPYALAVFEIDHLPDIRRRFGHSMGDALLKLLARLCSETIGGRSKVGCLRHGQFALFLPEMTQVEARALVKRISRSLTTESSKASGSRLAVTASIGIFSGTADVPIERAVEITDQCLARAKSQGGNNIITNQEPKTAALNLAPLQATSALKRHKTA
ncbi:GGDEF domain-containing protein [Roseibium algae]|uniref:diguanylate cyclase n=1 Tax=Roseibium algae TaxID=3123038 RepID=A0ABU8TIP2_9HYPH